MRQSLCAAVVLALFVSSMSHADQAPNADQAPEFSLRAIEGGNTVALADFEGYVVYLDFWASWCGPCLQSFPAMAEWQARFAYRGFRVIAVNLDEDRDAALKFLEDRDVDFTVLVDEAGATPILYDIPGLPTSFLIGRQGEILLEHAGFRVSDIELLEAAIGEALGAEAP